LAALLAALLFAVCPSKSEAVANVVGRSELLAALFTLASVRLALIAGVAARGLVAARACSSRAGRRKRARGASPGHSGASTGRNALNAAGSIIPSLLAVTIFAVVADAGARSVLPGAGRPAGDNPLVSEHGVRYAATALGLVARYARIVVFPFGLANDYSGGSIPIEGSLSRCGPSPAWRSSVARVDRHPGRVQALFVAIRGSPLPPDRESLVPVGAISPSVSSTCRLRACACSRLGDREVRKPRGSPRWR
jgi:hypothetical protein